MEQSGKLWFREFGKESLIIGSICLLFWLLFVYELDCGYKEATLRVLEAILIAALLNGVIWLVERLWAHRQAR